MNFNDPKLWKRMVCFGMVSAMVLIICVPCLPAQESVPTHTGSESNAGAAQWGVRILHLHLAAENQLLDLRFQVTDAQKALPILDRNLKAYLVNQKTGKAFPVPITKSGAMRQSTLKPENGREYFIWFSNPSGLTKAGDVMTLAVGENIRIKNIRVEKNPPPLDAKALEKIQQDKVGQWREVREKLRRDHEQCLKQCGNDEACRQDCDVRLADQEKSAYRQLVYGRE